VGQSRVGSPKKVLEGAIVESKGAMLEPACNRLAQNWLHVSWSDPLAYAVIARNAEGPQR
jgi:hypothetical protein